MSNEEPKLLWTPTPERVEAATMTRFARWVEATRGVDVSTPTTSCAAGR